jgi:hypothetical protein
MSIIATGVAHIINTIEDLLCLIELQHSLNISTDYDENGSILVKITFSLKNGKSEATIHDAGGKFSYYNLNGENLESINFNEQNLTNTIGSFHKALKALIILDRQQVNIVKSDNICRSSQG